MERITIKRAKELAIERNGRAPRTGYETLVLVRCEERETFDFDGRSNGNEKVIVSYWLANHAGGFTVREEWYSYFFTRRFVEEEIGHVYELSKR